MHKTALRYLPLAALCAAGMLVGAPLPATAQRGKQPLPEAPPPAQPLAVKVPRGETAEISLRIYGRKNEVLKYLIRTPPKHGRLTEPKVVEREVSAVTYTPPADLAITRDRFAYAVQNSAGVSAAVDVLITIVDLPPDLALPGALEYGSMLAGATAAKTLEISNRGGGVAEGRAEVEAPWKIEGTPKYRLAAGARAVFKIVFAPEKGGVFESAVRFSSQLETSVPVRGEALEAIAATPASIVLQNAPDDPVRAGAFELSNQTGEECRVTLSGGARLQVPAELAVPARGKVSVPVRTAADDVSALEGEVRVEAAGLTVRVPVRAARVGPLLRAGRGPVAFGRVDAAKPGSASFELENFGGAEARVSWEIGEPFVMDQPVAVLAPGEKKALVLRTKPAAAGRYRAWLTAKVGQQKLEIPVEAELFAKAVRPAAPRAVVAVGQRAVERPADDPVAAVPEADVPEAAEEPPPPAELPQILAELRVDLIRPEGVALTLLKPGSATIEWPVALDAAGRFRFESRRVTVDSAGELKVVWDEISKVDVRREGAKHVASLSGLRPGTAHGVRVVPLSAAGEPGKPLFTQFFVTPAAADWRPKLTPLRVLFAAFALCVGFMLRQRWLARRSA